MQPFRLRIELTFPHRSAPSKFWWRPLGTAYNIGGLLDEVGQELGLLPGDRSRLEATLDGYALLRGSKPDLLRDGDTLVVGLSRKRGAAAALEGAAAAAQRKRQKHLAEAPAATEQDGVSSEEGSSDEGSSSSDDTSSGGGTSKDSSSSSDDSSEEASEEAGAPAGGQQGGQKTPAPAQPAAAGGEDKKPSRSARRKAAKRRLRRMGVLPQGGRGRAADGGDAVAPGHGPTPETAQPAAQVLQQEPPRQQQRQAEKEGGQKGGQQGSDVPEVRVPPEWRSASVEEQPRRRQQQQQPQQQQPQQQQRRRRQKEEEQLQGLAPTAAAHGPLSEAAFSALPQLQGLPCVGDVLAYRLLEIGVDRLPGVSEPRCGRVVGVDGGSGAVTLEPHPDPRTHPLAGRRAQAAARRRAEAEAAGLEEGEEESEEEEEPGSLYDEQGVLTAELSAFVEVRVVSEAAAGAHARPPPAAPAPARAAVAAKAAALPASNGGEEAREERGELAPASYSTLGPPRPAAARGDVILPEGGWAALYEQLRERRKQLAQQGKHAVAATPPPPAAKQLGPTGVQSAPPAERSCNGGKVDGVRSSSLTPGATRPRAGVRRTALGPMLSMLRDAQELA